MEKKKFQNETKDIKKKNFNEVGVTRDKKVNRV